MSRSVRLEFEGALYHVTARGDRAEAIYLDETDREVWLSRLDETCRRFGFIIHAYCQMTNHYHLLVETPNGALAAGMRHFNGTYSQCLNRRHRLVGHVFQGRYKAIICQKERYLLELVRYVVLNPVRAHMVQAPEDWKWSSYRASLMIDEIPCWLQVDSMLEFFGHNKVLAIKRYKEFVHEGF